jgi:hypothetical protein
MQCLLVLTAVAAVTICGPSSLAADSPPAADHISRLIADLGSIEYTVREAASEELAQIGLPAFAALQSAANHPDREVRYRAQRVLGIIRRHDVERRLEAFLSGKDGSDDYPLPGWTRFSKTYGEGPEQRKLFVDMQRADGELLRAIEENPRKAEETLTARMAQAEQTLQLGAQSISFSQVVASLFVAAEPDVSLRGRPLSVLFSQCFQPSVREAIDGAGRREMPRKMLGAIISRADDMTAFQAMSVAAQFKLPEGIVPATRILKAHDGARTAALTQHALITIARLGDASHLPLVESDKLLHDSSQVAKFNENETTYTMEVRDVALATAVVLHKQDLRDYFEIPQNQRLDDPQMTLLNARYIGFSSQQRRAAAFTKWDKFKAEQPSR